MKTNDASPTADVAPRYDVLGNIGPIELRRDENYDLASHKIAIDTSADSSFGQWMVHQVHPTSRSEPHKM
jgi:hypothetical protein